MILVLQAAAAEHHEIFVQLEHKQHLLDKRLESMSTTVNSFHEQHHHAASNLRTHVNTFLTELISVVGHQFDSMQAELKKSQAETIQVCAITLLVCHSQLSAERHDCAAAGPIEGLHKGSDTA